MSRINYAENENYSSFVKKQLPFLIRNGFLMILSGLIIAALFFFFDWNKDFYLLPVVLFVFGLIELVAAWHIRQGLVNVGFVRLALIVVFMLKLKKLKND